MFLPLSATSSLANLSRLFYPHETAKNPLKTQIFFFQPRTNSCACHALGERCLGEAVGLIPSTGSARTGPIRWPRQLHAAAALESIGITGQPPAGIAKCEEWIYVDGSEEEHSPANSPAFDSYLHNGLTL